MSQLFSKQGLFAVKSMETFRRDADNSGMKRSLTAKDVTLIGVGEIIGAGIFVITGKAAALHAGPAIVLSFIISGIACAFAGLCYSEMAACVPIAGSAYTYAYATTGNLVAWVIGWDLALEYLAGAATVAVGWSAYLKSFLASLGVELGNSWTNAPVAFSDDKGFFVPEDAGILNLPAMLIVAACTLVLCFGVKESAMVNHVFVAIKVSVILLFLFSTFAYIQPANWSPFIPERTEDGKYGFQGVLRASVSVFFAYIGFDAVSTCAQETKKPSRDMPIGIMGSLLFCTVLYIMVSLNLTGITNYTNLNTAAPLADAVKELGMNWLKILVSVGGVAGLSSVILVSLMAQPRIFMAMSADGFLPPAFGKVHPTYGTPMLATILSGVVCVLGAGFLPLDVLGDITSAGTLFAFFLVCISVMVLRFTRPDIERPFKVPGGPILIPVLGAASSMLLIVTTGGHTVLRLVIWCGIGLVIYGLYGYRNSHARLGEDEAKNGSAEHLADKKGDSKESV
ncbi:amino acid/polyamine transporter I [Catenaria anguillulae PL171]|uniref:Amino acid/polyamine transporter I n=1 Tax=Catenaria anguillulae PL171 TaxID=765915 RepID=A0A1Y2HK58_9FUNG|nr:amino acid/polyamine transporter I [Catenaria anguillulae PL171]